MPGPAFERVDVTLLKIRGGMPHEQFIGRVYRHFWLQAVRDRFP